MFPIPQFNTDTLTEAHRRIAEFCKRQKDRAIGWAYEDAKILRAEFNGTRTQDLYAEIHHEPIFGFSHEKEIVTVRLRLSIDDGLLPKEGISLYEGEYLFGKENSWKRVGAILDEPMDRVDYFVQAVSA